MPTRGRSPLLALAGLVAFFTTLPAVIAAFFGGVVVDRLGSARDGRLRMTAASA